MKYLSRISSFLAGQRLLLLMCLFSLFALEGWGTDATFTPSGQNSGTLSGAPTGVTASFANTYNSANQMTSGNSQTLTLSGFDGFTITGITVHVRTNAKSGAGSGTLTINGNAKGSLANTGTIGDTYTNKSFSVTSTEVGESKTVVIQLSASSSSFYCDKYTITYTKPDYNVTYSRNDDTDGPKALSYPYTLPAAEDEDPACTGWDFAGWCSTTLASTSTPPTYITNAISDDQTIYAVYCYRSAAGALTGETIFAENFGSYAKDAVPSGSVTTNSNGRVVFGDSLVSYACTNGAGTSPGTTKIYNEIVAGGTSPELMVGKRGTPVGSEGGSFSITGIPKAGASTMTLTFRRNNTNAGDCVVSVDGKGYSLSSPSSTGTGPYVYSYTITCGSASTFKLTFTSPNDKNTRLDDIKIVVATTSITGIYTTSPSCCATKVTLSGGSPDNGSVSFANTTLLTCDEDKTVTMTIDPDDGYQLHTFSVATGDGKVATKSMSASPDLDNNSSAPQEITLTFEKDADGAYDVTATFTEMVVTSWSWTNHDDGAALTTDPIEIYVDQQAHVDVTYTPAKADLLSSHTAASYYNHDATGSAYVRNPNKASEYFTFYGKASTGEETTTITLTHSDDTSNPKSFPQLIYVKVLPLPRVHFEDLIHNESFADVVATISDNALAPTKTTPTHDDLDTPGSGNACELVHLHLMGWIRSDYSEVEDYLAGERDALSISEITSAGTGYWFTPNADINVLTYNGKTFYAVWAKIE